MDGPACVERSVAQGEADVVIGQGGRVAPPEKGQVEVFAGPGAGRVQVCPQQSQAAGAGIQAGVDINTPP
ncbi:MAG: hypothetical protein SXV54_09205 [Chloroflexota bacterium]|nr:hypothetical protein [Chloroflexota bacterium]